MTRKPVKDEFDMDSYMSGKNPTEASQKTHKQPTKAPQKAHRVENLQKYHIRLTESDWKVLQQHFEARGIKTSSGIRMIIKEYMERQGI